VSPLLVAEKLAPWATAAGLVALWWLFVDLFGIEDYILPSPLEAATAVYTYRVALLTSAAATLATTLAGFGVAVAVGSALGIAIGSSRLVYSALYPILVAFNSLPKAALVPILVIWFGVGPLPAIITAFVLSFFPIVVNVATGFATIEPELVDVLRALGATRLDRIRKVGLPRSLPYFFASLKIAITLSFVGSVIAEIIAGDRGIGHVMLVAGSDFNVPLIFGALLVVGAMGIIVYVLFAMLERRFTGWSVRALEYATGG
jgi:NitT/TauT family transport system permease protein